MKFHRPANIPQKIVENFYGYDYPQIKGKNEVQLKS